MNLNLFDDLPGIVAISAPDVPGQTCLSPAQAEFNKLIRQIEKKREQLAEWGAAVSSFQQKFTLELMPLMDVKNGLRTELVHRLDGLLDGKGLSKVERKNIADIIVEIAGDLLALGEDAGLRAILDKYQSQDERRNEAEQLAAFKAQFAELTGVDLGDEDEISPEDLIRRLHEQMTKERARAARQSKRKKSAKQIARERQQDEDAQQIKLSVREVYRKLASALHPDREPDPGERERKTSLMQRANQAYEKDDLLQLLELQIELDHIAPGALNQLGEERLLRYNKTLKQQLGQLDAEKTRLEADFRARFSISPLDLGHNARPASIMRLLAQDIAAYQGELHAMKQDLARITDVKSLKAWLRDMH